MTKLSIIEERAKKLSYLVTMLEKTERLVDPEPCQNPLRRFLLLQRALYPNVGVCRLSSHENLVACEDAAENEEDWVPEWVTDLATGWKYIPSQRLRFVRAYPEKP